MKDLGIGPDPQRVAELFDRALDRNQEDLESFLDKECAGDQALKNEVLDLLRFDPQSYEGNVLPNPHSLALTRKEASPPRADEAAFRPELAATQEVDGRTRQSRRPIVEAQDDTAIPTHIGRFEVTGKLGEGGMGVVYSGIDRTLDRKIALKLVRPDRARVGRVRMLREAQAMARVAHPNVVPIYEAGIHGEGIFFAMELVDGQTLRSWLDEEARDWRSILKRFVEAGRGLAAAHRAGVLHRDFKPDNVLIGNDGRARVLDFGLARATLSDAMDDAPPPDENRTLPFDAELTRPGSIMGTPGYMSPEHFEGQLGPWSDQWSYAVSLYRALYGALPFNGNTLDEMRDHVLAGHHATPPPSPIPSATWLAIEQGMARFPADRFSSLDKMVDALEAPLLLNPDLDRSVARKSRRRTSFAVALVGTVSLIVISVRTHFRYDIGLDGLTKQLLFGSAVVLLLGIVFRRELSKNAYNRRVVIFFALQLAALNAHRMYGMFHGMSVEDVVRVDAIFAAALDGLAAVLLESWFGIPAVAFVIYFFTTLLFPRILVPGFGICIIGSIALGAWFWREPRQPSASKGARGASIRSSSPRSDRESPQPR